ncbi:MAG TPA: excinuclease ABC subunit UvrC [Thermomicrobiales bacterium]|nr:excinuclease ABC subunit UvrC [Thermomicrobiales bacterium]
MSTHDSAGQAGAPAPFEGRLAALPTAPGCYLMKDARGQVIYVGKAKQLRDRVRSYFGSPRSLTGKTRELVSHIADFEVVRTDTEAEALILENELIKRHQPKYNILLKDDKTYPYLKITAEEWPTIVSTRRVLKDGARYFGPFADASAAYTTLRVLHRTFPYRKPNAPCKNKKITGDWLRPCQYYHMRQCLGPCIGATTREEYAAALDGAARFLQGRDEELLAERRARMEAAAEAYNFEEAARLRDEILDLEHVRQRQKIVSPGGADADILAVAQGAGGDACVQVSELRNGKLLGAQHYLMAAHIEDPPAEILQRFVTQHYTDAPLIPPQLLLQYPLPDAATVAEVLRAQRGGPVKLIVPQRGDKKQLVAMVAKSAAENLEQERLKWLNNEQKTTMALSELAAALDLPGLPLRIECYDISNIQGTNTVAAMVVFEDGRPKKSEYRKFAIRTVEGPNDFASLQETLRRRFKRARESTGEGDSWARLPDLIIIDGGKGQLSASLEVLRELAVDIPTVGLAKENEEIFLPENPVPVILPRDSQALFLVQRVRDETHRFAITFHRQKRGKSALRSSLDDLPGIGPKRKKALLKHFGSPKRIREASVEELTAVEGISTALAEKIRAGL